MVITTFKNNSKIVCYIYQANGLFLVYTGKPSDSNTIEFYRTMDYECACSEAIRYTSNC